MKDFFLFMISYVPYGAGFSKGRGWIRTEFNGSHFQQCVMQYIVQAFQTVKTIQFCFFTCFTSLNALSKLSLIAKLLFSMSPRKFLRDRKLLSTKKVDKALRASTISWGITTDLTR